MKKKTKRRHAIRLLAKEVEAVIAGTWQRDQSARVASTQPAPQGA